MTTIPNTLLLQRPSLTLPPPDVNIDAVTISDDSMTLTQAEFEGKWHEAMVAADEQAPVLAANLKRLIIETPDALPLYMENLESQAQREMTAASAKLSSIRGTGAGELLRAFENVLTNTTNGSFNDNQELLGKYSKYIVALSDLMTKINAKIKPEDDGKSNLNGGEIYKELQEFTKTWSGANGTIKTFDNQADANALAKRFRGGTAAVFENNGKFDVRFSFSRIAPITTAILDQEAEVSFGGGHMTGRSFLDIVKRALDNGHALPPLQQSGADLSSLFRGKGMNAHTVQSVTLATGDVQKTHQTDLDLLLNEFSRSTSQFDNLVKLYSSLATALTETCKSFL